MLHGLSFTWSLSPVGFMCFLILVVLYCLGLRRVSRLRRQNASIERVHPVRVSAFFLGILLFAFLLFSPLNVIGRTQLFSVHMLVMVLLTTACAPLLLAGCPEVLLNPILTLPGVNAFVRFVTRPVTASVIFNLSFLLWHTPKIFDIAQASPLLYDVMLLWIFLASLLNWWPLIGSLEELRSMGYPLQILYAFLDGQPVDIFAFVLVYSGVPIYTHYLTPPQFNFMAGGDQTVGGALLLIPGLVDFVVMSPLFIKWMGQIEHKQRLGDELRWQEEYEEYEDEEYADEPSGEQRPGMLEA